MEALAWVLAARGFAFADYQILIANYWRYPLRNQHPAMLQLLPHRQHLHACAIEMHLIVHHHVRPIRLHGELSQRELTHRMRFPIFHPAGVIELLAICAYTNKRRRQMMVHLVPLFIVNGLPQESFVLLRASRVLP